MVQTWHISSVIAAAITLVVAFVVRFVFHSLVVYAPRKPGARSRSPRTRRRARRAGDGSGRALAADTRTALGRRRGRLPKLQRLTSPASADLVLQMFGGVEVPCGARATR